MGPSERFALRWDGFKANAIDAFSNLREESEFLDVTLVADDGEKVGANKVVLAGGSAFFNKILKENPHSHPLIYMKGVGFEHLGYIMDFMYTGEARIFQDDLNQFLEIAQDLKVKGLTLPTPAPRQAAAEEPGPSLGMLRPSRRDVTSTCHEQSAPPSTISNPHTVQSAPYQSHESPEEPPPPLASSLLRSLKSAHRKHEDQVAPKIFAPNKGQSATEEYSSAPGITAPHEGRLATEDQASSNANIVASSQSYNAFQKSTSMEDPGGTCNVKVEVPVGDADLFNVYYETNEKGEAYISDVSKRVNVAVTAPDEGQVATEENRDIFHMEDRGDVGDAANVDVYCGNVIWNMRDVSKRVAAKVHDTGLCMEQEKNYQSVSAGKKVLVWEENNNSVSDAHVKQANDCYQLETKPFKKCSVNIKKVNISKYTEVSSKSRISSKNYDHEKNHDKKVGSMRSFDRKSMVDDMNDIKMEDMSSMNEHPTHDLGQENTTHGKPDPLSTKMFGMPSQIKRRLTSQTGENMYRYQCEVCHKKFRGVGDYKRHYRIHTGEKPFQCSVCLNKFSRYGSLKVHEIKFSHYSSLKEHERIPTFEMPYQCNVCLKKFRHVMSFKRHKIFHTDEKLY